MRRVAVAFIGDMLVHCDRVARLHAECGLTTRKLWSSQRIAFDALNLQAAIASSRRNSLCFICWVLRALESDRCRLVPHAGVRVIVFGGLPLCSVEQALPNAFLACLSDKQCMPLKCMPLH
jgi:hypothetical protein